MIALNRQPTTAYLSLSCLLHTRTRLHRVSKTVIGVCTALNSLIQDAKRVSAQEPFRRFMQLRVTIRRDYESSNKNG